MQNVDLINFIGLVLNIIGSIIIALSLGKYLLSIHGSVAIHDMQLKSLINKDDKILVGNIGNLLTKGSKNARIATLIGLIILIAGFVLQAIHFIIICLHKAN